MGTWSTAISGSDTYADVSDRFFELYNGGATVAAATQTLLAEFEHVPELPADSHDFWFAVAKAQWDCGALDEAIVERVTEIVESGANLSVWEELEATPADLRKRAKVLSAFQERLQTPNPRPKKPGPRRSRLPKRPALFEKGTCLSIELPNGEFGGALVLETQAVEQWGQNLIAVTYEHWPQPPTVQQIARAHSVFWWMETINREMQKIEVKRLEIGWYGALHPRTHFPHLQEVGQLDVHTQFSLNDPRFFHSRLENLLPHSELSQQNLLGPRLITFTRPKTLWERLVDLFR